MAPSAKAPRRPNPGKPGAAGRAAARGAEAKPATAAKVRLDERLVERVRELLPRAEERRMFGGAAWMERGNLVVGVIGDSLIARLGPGSGQALGEPGVVPFDFTGRPMAGWVVVTPDGMAEEEDLAHWVERARAFVATLPAK